MSKSDTDKMVLDALVGRHGTTIINNPSKALIAVGKENSELHEQIDQCWKELDVYRNALTVVAYLDPKMMDGGTVETAFAKAQQLARAALAQIVMGSVDLALLRKVQQRKDDHGRDN
jgi:conjugal transfer/entry exclusion protein